jgi:hypothetical protein
MLIHYLGRMSVWPGVYQCIPLLMALRRVVVGNNHLLLHMDGIHAKHRLPFEAMANAFVVD